ncbi:YfbM family protein [Coleofasciculus sp. FACHB-712]|uniref:YfbM family protein n=1 Tax=Coleofasciculus sp. FACHB-712 TaxID=2692789 RepID=UPI001685CF8D|nr:YfbM family protein [Coleofasciculus sp. FACHB-712]MBD1944178.1 YfbM family protein [Coleofasciculus sp. FACHB-712]
MGMRGDYRRVTTERLAELQQNPDSILGFLFPDDGAKYSDKSYLDIDKAWHGIHFLLTGTKYEGETPLVNVVMGGSPLDDPDNPQFDYGPACFLIPEEVQEVAEALSQISEADLQARFHPSALSAANIYPNIWERGTDEFEYLMFYYLQLVKFFQDAAKFRNAIVFYIA